MVRTAAAVMAHRNTASEPRAWRLMTLAPSQNASVHSGISIASGLTAVPMNVLIGIRAATAAHASWGRRRRPKTSPANSQAATAVIDRSRTPNSRIAYRRPNAVPPLSIR